MKAFFWVALIALAVCSSCHKSTSGVSHSGHWRLAYKYSSIGAVSQVLTPGPDSSVYLALKSESKYTTWLNDAIVSQGYWLITTDSINKQDLLQLSQFKPTGIFALFNAEQISTNGQTHVVFDNMFVHISHDSLTLNGALTPGGTVSYLFLKQY